VDGAKEDDSKTRVDLLQGPTCQIRSARECYQWRHKYKDMPRYRFLISLILILIFLNESEML
jgi:hypothetical protein